MKKHAYLIIVHHEPEILQMLVSALDDYRNDIYIHFDKKYVHPPSLRVKHAQLFILDKRLDVRWADRSQIEVELLLFETAYQHFPYEYFHLLSGVDLPIKPQDYIHSFFNKNKGKEFIGFTQGNTEAELIRKVKRYHLFPKEFRNKSNVKGFLIKIVRRAFLEVQEILGIKRHKDILFKKGTNWVSITSDLVAFVLSQKEEILKMYSYTFCADEIFIQTICWNSSFKEHVYDLNNSRNSSKRMIQWLNNELVDWEIEDVDFLLESPGLFARKFSKRKIEVAENILKRIQ